MTENFSKGPWVESHEDDEQNGTNPLWWPVIHSADGTEIVGTEGFFSLHGREFDIANARLAAASPELYQSLKEMTELWHSICDVNGWDPDHVSCYPEALKALKKAIEGGKNGS